METQVELILVPPDPGPPPPSHLGLAQAPADTLPAQAEESVSSFVSFRLPGNELAPIGRAAAALVDKDDQLLLTVRSTSVTVFAQGKDCLYAEEAIVANSGLSKRGVDFTLPARSLSAILLAGSDVFFEIDRLALTFRAVCGEVKFSGRISTDISQFNAFAVRNVAEPLKVAAIDIDAGAVASSIDVCAAIAGYKKERDMSRVDVAEGMALGEGDYCRVIVTADPLRGKYVFSHPRGSQFIQGLRKLRGAKSLLTGGDCWILGGNGQYFAWRSPQFSVRPVRVPSIKPVATVILDREEFSRTLAIFSVGLPEGARFAIDVAPGEGVAQLQIAANLSDGTCVYVHEGALEGELVAPMQSHFVAKPLRFAVASLASSTIRMNIYDVKGVMALSLGDDRQTFYFSPANRDEPVNAKARHRTRR